MRNESKCITKKLAKHKRKPWLRNEEAKVQDIQKTNRKMIEVISELL